MLIRIVKIVGIVLGILFLALTYHISTLGYFRTIENPYQGTVLQALKVTGSEDFAISRSDSFMIFSSCDFGQLRGSDPAQGSLSVIDLRKPPYTLKTISQSLKIPLYPHGISMMKIDSAAYELYVINHRSDSVHTIEIFKWQEDTLTHHNSLKHPAIHSPNDLTVISSEEFYITNDHGSKTHRDKMWEDYLRLRKANVIYYNHGETTVAAEGISYANGIAFDRARDLVYVASPTRFEILVYDRDEDGALSIVDRIDTGTGVDNLELDEEGNIWSGAHPSPLDFADYSKDTTGQKISPSEVVKISYRGKDDYEVETIYMNDGNIISGSSVAIPFDNKIWVGTVKDDQMIVLGEEQ